jgi:ABC-type sugar transport system substrate-binding protein
MSRGASILLAACALALSGCPDSTPPASTVDPPAGPVAEDPAQRPVTPRTGAKRVALFVPHEDLFWLDFKAFMLAATDQLGLELVYYVADNGRERMKEQLREATAGPDAVDAVVFQNFKQSGGDLLTIADEAGVPAFLVNADVDEAEWGAPRERLGTWLGTMVTDGRDSGHRLATLLVDEALERGLVDSDGKVHVIAIGGIVSDEGSRTRVEGLHRAVAEREDIILHQTVPTDWSQEDGARKAAVLLERFPSTAVVWAASDPLALGAVESLKAMGRRPGVDVLVGGFDWTVEALDAIRAGDLYTSLGGHFMDGGWVAVLLHDYLEGRDFGERGVRFHSRMQPITSEDVELFYPAISDAKWDRVDFRALASPQGDYVFDATETLRRQPR